MAFIVENSAVISFAEYSDVVKRDSRLFDANESLNDVVVEDHLIRATERILSKLRSTAWWQEYYIGRSSGVTFTTAADVPALDVNRIRARQNDFTDLCVYTALGEFTLPSIADFGSEDSSERQKMGYYVNKAEDLFQELVRAGDWYDFNDDGTIQSKEKRPGAINLRRVR
jgi:hypothetical protein